MKKKVWIFLMVLCMCLGIMAPETSVWAASGKTSIAVSKQSLDIGDTMTVTGKAVGPNGEKVLATMKLSWDAGVLEYVDCSVDSNGGGGSRLVNGDSFTITLKAISAGTSKISLSASDGVLFDTVESLDTMEGSGTSVTVNNAASTTGGTTGATTPGNQNSDNGSTNNTDSNANVGATLSADNSLKYLAISPGTLSPAFTYSNTSYTATVGSDVGSIAVSATPTNAKAVVESVTGHDNLVNGTNTIKIVVKAENGVTATYKIQVTKQAQTVISSEKEEAPSDENEKELQQDTEKETISVNGITYQIGEDFSKEVIPADFVEQTITYHGKQYKGVSYSKGNLKLLWLETETSDDETSGEFYVCDETSDTIYSFVRFAVGTSYVIALQPPTENMIPESYTQTYISVDDTHTMVGYQAAEDASEGIKEYYLFYGVNHEGKGNWYQYDALEGTYQRISLDTIGEPDTALEESNVLQQQYAELSEKYDKEKASSRKVLAILIFVIAVLVIVIINLVAYGFRNRGEDTFEDEFEEELPKKVRRDVAEPRHEVKKPRKEATELKQEVTKPQSENKRPKQIQTDMNFKRDDIDVIDFNDL